MIATDLDRAETKAYQLLKQSLMIVNYPLRHQRRAEAKMPDPTSYSNANGERQRLCDYLQDRRARSSELKQAITALLELDASLMELAPIDDASLESEALPDTPALAAARVVRVQLSDIEPLESRLARPR